MQITSPLTSASNTPAQSQHTDTDTALSNAAKSNEDAIIQVFVDGFIARMKDDVLSGKSRTPQEW